MWFPHLERKRCGTGLGPLGHPSHQQEVVCPFSLSCPWPTEMISLGVRGEGLETKRASFLGNAPEATEAGVWSGVTPADGGCCPI